MIKQNIDDIIFPPHIHIIPTGTAIIIIIACIGYHIKEKHNICRYGTHISHLSVIINRISGSAKAANPTIAGNTTNAESRSNCR